jgi:SAM-dependent methyltransferase
MGSVLAPMANHPVFAAFYDRMCAPAERAGLADRRRRLLAGATGEVLEVGGGTGANLPHYPSDAVSRVVVVEPDAAMRRRLLGRLASAPVPVEVHETGIDDAVFPDRSFDTVVSTFVLCTVPDPATALARVRALLRPGGRLLFLEHVAGIGIRRRLQRLASPLRQRLVGGCHPDRDLVAAIRRAGFLIAECDRFELPKVARIARPAAQGVAYVRAAA